MLLNCDAWHEPGRFERSAHDIPSSTHVRRHAGAESLPGHPASGSPRMMAAVDAVALVVVGMATPSRSGRSTSVRRRVLPSSPGAGPPDSRGGPEARRRPLTGVWTASLRRSDRWHKASVAQSRPDGIPASVPRTRPGKPRRGHGCCPSCGDGMARRFVSRPTLQARNIPHPAAPRAPPGRAMAPSRVRSRGLHTTTRLQR